MCKCKDAILSKIDSLDVRSMKLIGELRACKAIKDKRVVLEKLSKIDYEVGVLLGILRDIEKEGRKNVG